MHRVVLEHVGSIFQVEERIVDGDGHDITFVFHGGTADEAADTAESVDSDLDSHDDSGEYVVDE